ncbi:uncharacterized protein LOC125568352 [Nematostella vectensis]|uniref:uncharacterized protein LOC125568351 n=1 Tax=Nematostella vectensis TaxID=45351 RepID=UPI002076DB74|nr:uncharacterized protein LOC125568351 [Nematostella vectensis]XP_048586386.1 uncharacterized protein LOC125568352 [Nematostella vectensis]
MSLTKTLFIALTLGLAMAPLCGWGETRVYTAKAQETVASTVQYVTPGARVLIPCLATQAKNLGLLHGTAHGIKAERGDDKTARENHGDRRGEPVNGSNNHVKATEEIVARNDHVNGGNAQVTSEGKHLVTSTEHIKQHPVGQTSERFVEISNRKEVKKFGALFVVQMSEKLNGKLCCLYSSEEGDEYMSVEAEVRVITADVLRKSYGLINEKSQRPNPESNCPSRGFDITSLGTKSSCPPQECAIPSSEARSRGPTRRFAIPSIETRSRGPARRFAIPSIETRSRGPARRFAIPSFEKRSRGPARRFAIPSFETRSRGPTRRFAIPSIETKSRGPTRRFAIPSIETRSRGPTRRFAIPSIETRSRGPTRRFVIPSIETRSRDPTRRFAIPSIETRSRGPTRRFVIPPIETRPRGYSPDIQSQGIKPYTLSRRFAIPSRKTPFYPRYERLFVEAILPDRGIELPSRGTEWRHISMEAPPITKWVEMMIESIDAKVARYEDTLFQVGSLCLQAVTGERLSSWLVDHLSENNMYVYSVGRHVVTTVKFALIKSLGEALLVYILLVGTTLSLRRFLRSYQMCLFDFSDFSRRSWK